MPPFAVTVSRGKRATCDVDEHGTARAAPAGTVVGGRCTAPAVRLDRSTPCDPACTGEDEPTARGAAGGSCIVPRARATAAAEGERRPGCRECGAALSAVREAGEPRIAASTSCAPVAAAAPARVLVVRRLVAVRAASPRGPGRPSPLASVRVALPAGVDRAATLLHPPRSAGGAFTLRAVRGARGTRPEGARRETGAATQLAVAPAAEPECGDARRARHREHPGHVQGEHPSGRSIPGRRRDPWPHGCRCVLGNAHNLERPRARRRGRGRLRVGVDQPAPGALPDHGNRPGGDGSRGDHVFVPAGDRGSRQRAARRAPCAPVAVRVGVGGIDVRALHLDHRQQVAGTHRRRSPGRRSHRDRRSARRHRPRPRVVRVHNTRERAPGAVPARCGAELPRCSPRRFDEASCACDDPHAHDERGEKQTPFRGV